MPSPQEVLGLRGIWVYLRFRIYGYGVEGMGLRVQGVG